MNDQRIVRRPSLCVKYTVYRLCIPGISTKSVDGFRRKSNKLSGGDQVAGDPDIVFVKIKK